MAKVGRPGEVVEAVGPVLKVCIGTPGVTSRESIDENKIQGGTRASLSPYSL